MEIIPLSSQKEEDSLPNQLILQPNPNAEALLNSSDPCSSVKLYCKLSQLEHQRALILNKVKNDPETEQEFRKTCLLYENAASDSLLRQAYQEYVNSYQKITSTYLVNDYPLYPKLFIYDTENEREELKVLKMPATPKKFDYPLEFVIPLPNGELFAIGYYWFIIDKNCQAKRLPRPPPYSYFTAIYYNRNIYCFGDENFKQPCRRFNLDENRWSILSCMPKYDDYDNSNNIVFNKNILISGTYNAQLLLYSIDIDSFSLIPYRFSRENRKILISTEERVYLIECGWKAWIYESEIGNVYDWKQLTISNINNFARQVYCSYNKGGIYISIIHSEYYREYFKFDLSHKIVAQISLYNDKIALKRLENNIETIDYSKTFKLNPGHPVAYNKKGCTLYYIAKSIEAIEKYSKQISRNSNDWISYLNKGDYLHNLGRYIEAIDCYDAAIKLQPNFGRYYRSKGNSLYKLKKYSEAIDCYSELIKLRPDDSNNYFNKGKALYKINNYTEALECYNKAISIDPRNFLFFCYRAKILNDLGYEGESIEDFNKAYDFVSSAQFYTYRTPIQDWLGLAKALYNLQMSVVKFKDELQKIKNLKNPELCNEIDEKETAVKERNSQILKKGVKCLVMEYQSNETIEKIKNEVKEHEEAMIGIITQLCSY